MFLLDEIADRFFILLQGSVLVYKQRANNDIDYDRSLLVMLQVLFEEMAGTRPKISVEELLSRKTFLRDIDEDNILHRFSAVGANRVEYKDSYI